MKNWFLALCLGLAAVLSACVTINIYFPAAAAEKAADKIIDEVWQLKQGSDGAAKPAATPQKAPVKSPDAMPAEPAPK